MMTLSGSPPVKYSPRVLVSTLPECRPNTNKQPKQHNQRDALWSVNGHSIHGFLVPQRGAALTFSFSRRSGYALAQVVATYTSAFGEPRSASTELVLPLALVCRVVSHCSRGTVLSVSQCAEVGACVRSVNRQRSLLAHAATRAHAPHSATGACALTHC